MRNEKGFSLMQIVMSVIILLILATVVGLFVLGYMKDARLASMKEDASAIQEAIQVEYGKVGELPKGDLVELGERNKEIVSEIVKGDKESIVEGICSSEIRGVVVSKDKFIVESEDKVNSGSLSVDKEKVDGDYTNTSVKAYEINQGKIVDQLSSVSKLGKYVVLDCGYGKVGGGSVISEEDLYKRVTSDSCEVMESRGYECIKTIEDLKSMNMDGKYALVNNLDMSGELDWRFIGTDSAPFSGELNGNGYVISNFHAREDQGDVEGFFGYVDGSVFKNIEMENMRIESNNTNPVGFIAFSGGEVVIENSKISGEIRAVEEFGGFVGSVHSGNLIMDGIEFDGKLLDESREGYYGVGALVGYSSAPVNISNAKIDADIVGGEFIGGVVGESYGLVSVDNIDLNLKIEAIANLGSVIGFGSDVEVKNVQVNADIVGSGGVVGGLAGYTYGNSAFNNIKGEVYVKGVGNTGGLLGELSGGDLGMNGLDVEFSVEGLSDNTGGLVGSVDGGDLYINKSKISTDINSIGSDVGGIVGIINGSVLVEENEINSVIEGNNRVGGIIGYNQDYESSIELKNNEVKSVVKGVDDVGGAIGASDAATVVENSFIVFDVEGEDQLGGLMGSQWGPVLEVRDTDIKGEIKEQVDAWAGYASGGIVGDLYGGYDDEWNVFEGVTVDVDIIDEHEGSASYVGGMVGGSWGKLKIRNSEVNAYLEGYESVGGVLGYQNNSLDVDDLNYKGTIENTFADTYGTFGMFAGVLDLPNGGNVIKNVNLEGSINKESGLRTHRVGGFAGGYFEDGYYESYSGGLDTKLSNIRITAELNGMEEVGAIFGDDRAEATLEGVVVDVDIQAEDKVGGISGSAYGSDMVELDTSNNINVRVHRRNGTGTGLCELYGSVGSGYVGNKEISQESLDITFYDKGVESEFPCGN